VDRKGKAGPFEAGRGKYSPLANPEEGHFGGIEAKKQRSHVLKFRFPIKLDTYKDISIKTQETPEISYIVTEELFMDFGKIIYAYGGFGKGEFGEGRRQGEFLKAFIASWNKRSP